MKPFVTISIVLFALVAFSQAHTLQKRSLKGLLNDNEVANEIAQVAGGLGTLIRAKLNFLEGLLASKVKSSATDVDIGGSHAYASGYGDASHDSVPAAPQTTAPVEKVYLVKVINKSSSGGHAVVGGAGNYVSQSAPQVATHSAVHQVSHVAAPQVASYGVSHVATHVTPQVATHSAVHQVSHVATPQIASYGVSHVATHGAAHVNTYGSSYGSNYATGHSARTYAAPAPVTRTYVPPASAARTYAAPAPVTRTYVPPASAARTYAAPAPVTRTYVPPAPAARTYVAPAPIARTYVAPLPAVNYVNVIPKTVSAPVVSQPIASYSYGGSIAAGWAKAKK